MKSLMFSLQTCGMPMGHWESPSCLRKVCQKRVVTQCQSARGKQSERECLVLSNVLANPETWNSGNFFWSEQWRKKKHTETNSNLLFPPGTSGFWPCASLRLQEFLQKVGMSRSEFLLGSWQATKEFPPPTWEANIQLTVAIVKGERFR